MRLRRLRSIPRLSFRVLAHLLDRRMALARYGPLPLRATEGVIGEVTWRRRAVTVRGWTRATSVGFGFDDRAPLAAGPGAFAFDLPRPERRADLLVRASDGSPDRVLGAPGRLREAGALLRALPAALAEVAGEWRVLLRFLRTGDPSASARLRHRFGLTPEAFPVPALPNGFFAEESRATSCARPPTVVIPVHDAAEDMARLVKALPPTLPDAARVIVVDDGSTDPRIATLLACLESTLGDRLAVFRHRESQGFVAAANAGISHALRSGGGHIVILNSDALPPEDWLPRLLGPIEADRDVASVTPLSTNAEILTVPAPGLVTLPDESLVAAMDAVARRMAHAHATCEVPTGIGFCMALNRRFLDRIGLFDPDFGRGYGEEVDWCRRAVAHGGRNVAALNLVVGHRGGASFGAEEKARRIRAAGRVVSSRWPDYDASVQKWTAADPVAIHRMAVSMAWLDHAAPDPVPIFLGHAFGGGAEAALAGEVTQALSTQPGALVLRVGLGSGWRVEMHRQDRVERIEAASSDDVEALLSPLSRRRIVYSCGVGAADPAAVPRLLWRLARPGDALELRLHDFFPVSPSWNLLDGDGIHRGVPPETCRDPAHRLPAVGGRPALALSDWRGLWRPVVARADRIVAYSASSARLFEEAYPDSAPQIDVAPHRLTGLPARLPAGGSAIGVLGGINRAKGAGVLEELCRRLPRGPRVVVVGEMDGQFRLPPPHLVHGRYDRPRIGELARAYDIGAWIIPSVCPETFSFSTHEALATGLPVVCYDLGAQAEAVRAAPNGIVAAGTPGDAGALLAALSGLVPNLRGSARPGPRHAPGSPSRVRPWR